MTEEPLEITEELLSEDPALREKVYRDVVLLQGKVLDEVATLARKAKLSGNPGVSVAGAQILAVVERVL